MLAERLVSELPERGFRESDEIALEIIQSGHPDSFVELFSYLATRRNAALSSGWQPDHPVELEINALSVVACDLGSRHCRPYSDVMWDDCGFTFQDCDPAMSLQQYVMEYLVPMGQHEQLRQLVANYRRALVEGRFAGTGRSHPAFLGEG